MSAHISCRPWSYDGDLDTGCFVVCAEHGIKRAFGRAHAVARAACLEHNTIHHADERRNERPLLSIIYGSSATDAFSDQDRRELLERARARNRAFGITGMLLAEDGWFLQALEGPAPLVEDLMESIQRDPRHGHIHVMSRELRQRRRFPDWTMAEGHIGEVESQPLSQFYEALLLTRGQAASSTSRPAPR